MDSTPKIRRDRRRRRRLLAILVAVMAVGSSTTAALSLAAFTSQAAVAADFSTGTIAIQANNTTLPAVGTVTFTSPTGIMPGWAQTGKVAIKNNGADLRYAMTSNATTTSGTNLANAMSVAIRALPGDASCALAGTSVVSGGLNGIAFGDPTQGADTGDRDLGAGATETLCFDVSLPLATLDTYQNTNTSVTFTFSAEQTANNP